MTHTLKSIFLRLLRRKPKGRRSLCYDDAALNTRKEHKPKGSALAMANEMGIELLDESTSNYKNWAILI